MRLFLYVICISCGCVKKGTWPKIIQKLQQSLFFWFWTLLNIVTMVNVEFFNRAEIEIVVLNRLSLLSVCRVQMMSFRQLCTLPCHWLFVTVWCLECGNSTVLWTRGQRSFPVSSKLDEPTSRLSTPLLHNAPCNVVIFIIIISNMWRNNLHRFYFCHKFSSTDTI